MTDKAQLKRMQQIADLIRDRDLSRLSATLAAKAKTEGLLAALDNTQSPTELDMVVAAQVVDRFGMWTANRRIVLNQQLARDTVVWMGARTEAQRAFGRSDVLKKLNKKA